MKKMKVLELFAGTRSVGRAFEARGHELFAVEWDRQHEKIDWYVDVNDIRANDILEKFGRPDIIWASLDCTTFSMAGIFHHRTKNKENGNLDPKSEKAEFADKTNKHVLALIDELNPKYYFIENPRAGLRSMHYMKDYPIYTTTYCQYGFPYMKGTDIWTNHPSPNLKEPCKVGAPCHERAPRGSQSGLLGVKSIIDRSRIPDELCNHIVDICEEGELS